MTYWKLVISSFPVSIATSSSKEIKKQSNKQYEEKNFQKFLKESSTSFSPHFGYGIKTICMKLINSQCRCAALPSTACVQRVFGSVHFHSATSNLVPARIARTTGQSRSATQVMSLWRTHPIGNSLRRESRESSRVFQKSGSTFCCESNVCFVVVPIGMKENSCVTILF